MNLHRTNLSSDRLSKALLGTLAVCSFAGAARAQATQLFNFSVDWHGPTVGMPDSGIGFPITEGDILKPATGLPAFGPLPVPAIQYSAGFGPPAPGLGLMFHAPCVGHPGGTPCKVEVDALDYGRALRPTPGMALKGKVMFSVDRFAVGAGPAIPNVLSENAPGVNEASADVFVALGLVAGPLPPFAAPLPGNTGIVDGNGLISGSGFVYKGVGIFEPLPPVPGPAAPGDNLDALALGFLPGPIAFPPMGIWFSLDSAFMDPLLGVPNTGSALVHGFVGGDVLHVLVPGGPPMLYAPAGVLGLNMGGTVVDADDLDALVISENGLAGYQPSVFPNDWAGGATDMLLFSVRRGSAVIGMPDSIFGIPICEGDILTTPLPPPLGGVSPFPGMYIAAENLGLMTFRGPPPIAFSDDLDALEIPPFTLFDCNGNGIEDGFDIATGGSSDINKNGIPDECELLATSFCFCPAPLGPCGNHDPTAGCKNSTGLGGKLTPSGTSSCILDNLVLSATQLPPGKPGLLLQGGTAVPPTPFFDGRRCVNGPLFRHAPKVTSATGTATYGPLLVAYTLANFGPPGWITPGSTWNFQFWHRDAPLPCGTRANLTNAVAVTFTP